MLYVNMFLDMNDRVIYVTTEWFNRHIVYNKHIVQLTWVERFTCKNTTNNNN